MIKGESMQISSNGWITPELNEEDISGFVVLRSIANNTKFNVFAVDARNDVLFIAYEGRTLAYAMNVAQILNQPYKQEIEYIQSEIKEVVRQDGTTHYFQVQI